VLSGQVNDVLVLQYVAEVWVVLYICKWLFYLICT